MKVNVAIVGGGVAGLWTGNALAARGYSVALVSRTPLGQGQTLASQGVIHGGAKYALAGRATDSSRELAEMPHRWREAMAGRGDVDLWGIEVLSPFQVLWSLPHVASRVVSFFGSKLMRGQSSPLPRREWPEALRHEKYRGSVFRIDEPVLDPVSIVAKLADNLRGKVFLGDPVPVPGEHGIRELQISGEPLIADFYLLAAGSGNGPLLEAIDRKRPGMQLRPLHQLVVRGDLPDFYSVCIGTGPKPPVVITTHRDASGRTVWWIGGDIAEARGVARCEDEQIEAGRAWFGETFPWIDWKSMEWFSARADRAEPSTETGERPPGAFCQREGNVITCWPSKLALAPNLADRVIAEIEESLCPRPAEGRFDAPAPTLGRPPWDLP